jgi:LacI family transcriptional regulator
MTHARRRTLRDIAESLDLSVNTVSRALGGKDSVSEATRALVVSEADRIGYVPNVHARSLVLGSVMMIGLVITNPSNPFYAQLIHAIEKRGQAEGYSLLLVVSDESEEYEARAVESLVRSGVDGAIVVPVQGESNPWVRLTRVGIPVVFLNRDMPGVERDFVGIDNRRGAREAAEHVIAQGARRVALLEEDLPITTVTERTAGFTEAMDAAGLEITAQTVIPVATRRDEQAALPWHPDEAYRVAQRVLARKDRPDAFVLGNDYYALGLYRALAERGLRVPEDVLVVGYGDYPFAAFLAPPLSTVRLPAEAVGRSAVDLLLERMTGPSLDPVSKRLVAPELTPRASTADGA